jgi:hypothetical protein
MERDSGGAARGDRTVRSIGGASTGVIDCPETARRPIVSSLPHPFARAIAAMRPPSVVRILALAVLALVAAGSVGSAQQVEILSDPGSGPTHFAADRIAAALRTRGLEVTQAPLSTRTAGTGTGRILLFPSSSTPHRTAMNDAGAGANAVLEPEGFALASTGGAAGTIWVMGHDEAGVLYGGLELAEQIELYGLDGIRPTVQNPYMAIRGTKFNIPLDARTPSYTDMSDVAQRNIPEMWSLEFWKAYLDQLALHRYNLVSLWNLHPFPSMVRVPEYPDIALADVKRSRGPLAENYSTRVVDIAGPEILANLETVRTMTIEEKMEFWREVMRYAKDRNIDFYVMTWNVYTYGTEGRYGITDDFRNATTIDYFRRSVRAMFDAYPLLAGIGLTTGENFGQDTRSASFREKEDWAFRTYGQGVLDAAAAWPGRHIAFIHRLHETGVQSDAAAYAADANVAAVDIADWFAPLVADGDIEFLFSFKYAQAHVYSSTRQRFHEDYVRDIQGMKTLWTLRNDDVYYFRWGAPDFVREFFVNMPGDEVSRGYYYGSDQYVWGREFLSRNAGARRELELEKHWYQWMLWGRLGYDPSIPDERFRDIVRSRFPTAPADELFRAWREASMIYPITTGFHWGLYDFHWYIEGSRGRSGVAGSPTGFHDVNRFITLGPHSGTGYASIPQYVEHVRQGAPLHGTSPVEVAEMLRGHADRALEIVARLQHGGDPELRATLTDIETMAYLGRYYGHKIRGATELALFRAGAGEAHQVEAERQLREGARYWRLYAATALGQYTNPLWTNRVGIVDWRATMAEVVHDIVIAGGKPGIPSAAPSARGMVIEAEGAAAGGLRRSSEVEGFTGGGYMEAAEGAEEGWIEWKYTAPARGEYMLELRYAVEAGVHPTTVAVNGASLEAFTLWTTGDGATWGFDRMDVALTQGENTIRLRLPETGRARLDHLRVEPVGGPVER